jgi:murein DD-endopeptidase MepM/ murein hydrolase activator NlpD
MSRRSSRRNHGDQSGRASDGRQHRAAEVRQSAGYTLGHAGRQLRLRPIAFWIAVGTLVIMAAWTITTATYFAFRDDVLTRLLARQAEIQFGYEDRIAELRAQVDRISSRQLLDQEQYEQQLDKILRRQAALESRATALSGLGDVTGSIRQPVRAGAGGEPRTTPLKPSIGDRGAFVLPGDRKPLLDVRTSLVATGDMAGTIARLQASLDRIEQRQAATLDAIEDSYDSRAKRIRGVLIELGVNAGKSANAEGAGAVGGPFVPVRAPREAYSFERRLHRISSARSQLHRLTRRLATVPIRRPLDGVLDASSGFGVRNDPFNGSPAMHTGLDLNGDPGDAVRAAADGTVKTAGWSGGYGKAVDIDHGNGMSTRYGHLSSIEVRAGQFVRAGQLIGKVGSTGRSTGPHLHYETRVRGEAVDPQKFLRAGRRLEASL